MAQERRFNYKDASAYSWGEGTMCLQGKIGTLQGPGKFEKDCSNPIVFQG